MNNRRVGTAGNQKGFASIVIAIIMVLVLSLTTVGFAQLMQREQRNALDKQLSNQAYYAAESGVNDAAKAINNGFTAAKKSCGPITDAGQLPSGTDLTAQNAALTYLNDNQVDVNRSASVGGTATNSSYSCLLIDPTPQDLEYNLPNTGKPRYAQMTGVDNANPTALKQIGSLEISWQNSGGGDSYAPAGSPFTPADEWPYSGLLKIGLTPLTNNGIDRAKLIRETYTAFLFPNQAVNPSDAQDYSYGSGINGSDGVSGGPLLNGNCHDGNTTSLGTPGKCNIKITNLGQISFLITLEPIYKPINVTIKAFGTGGEPLRIKNAQTLVDSTGRAQDVLRRIQVRIPTRNNYSIPDGTQAVQAVCKQLNLYPGHADPGTDTENCPLP